MSDNRFIYGLWHGPNEAKLVTKGKADLAAGAPLARELGATVYAFDTQSVAWLAEVGICDPVMIRGLENPTPASQWTNKLLAMRHAFADGADAIVWLDWRTMRMRPLPESFWNVLGAGQPIQVRLMRLKGAKTPWRNCEYNQRHTAAGAFVYIREAGIVEELIRIMEENQDRPDNNPFHDETAYSYLIDQREKDYHNGDWSKNPCYPQRHWRDAGYDPVWYSSHKEVFKNLDSVVFAGGEEIYVELVHQLVNEMVEARIR